MTTVILLVKTPMKLLQILTQSEEDELQSEAFVLSLSVCHCLLSSVIVGSVVLNVYVRDMLKDLNEYFFTTHITRSWFLFLFFNNSQLFMGVSVAHRMEHVPGGAESLLQRSVFESSLGFFAAGPSFPYLSDTFNKA